jgi:CRP-like cAMP-binding protein
LVTPHTFTTTAVCAEACRLAILNTEDVQRLMTEDDKLGRLLLHNLSAVIADRLRRVQERLAELAR